MAGFDPESTSEQKREHQADESSRMQKAVHVAQLIQTILRYIGWPIYVCCMYNQYNV